MASLIILSRSVWHNPKPFRGVPRLCMAIYTSVRVEQGWTAAVNWITWMNWLEHIYRYGTVAKHSCRVSELA